MNLSYERAILFGSILGLALTPVVLASCADSVSVHTSTGSAADTGNAPSLEVVHEACNVESSDAQHMDANGDKKPDVTTVLSGEKKVCRAVDLNFDGKIDQYTYYDDQGLPRRTEADYDRDGLIDEITTYKAGKIIERDRETNLDGKLDTWDTYENGKLVKRRRDGNADGRVEQWWTFPDPSHMECPVVAYDTDGDGRPDNKLDICKEREKEAKAQGFDQAAQKPAPADQADAGSGTPATPEGDKPKNESTDAGATPASDGAAK